MKYLLLLALLGYVYYAWRKQRGVGRGPSSASGGSGPHRSARGAAPQEMVACASCGLHLPREEALTGPQGRLYCCPAHREQGAS